MKTVIAVYNEIRKVVSFFSKLLGFDKYKKATGRKLAISLEETVSLALFWKKNNIATKKSIHRIFNLKCSYKTLVVNLNRWYRLAMLVLVLIMKRNERNQHIVKHIDSTDIPVCLFKNAKPRKNMKIMMTKFQQILYDTRAIIELNFRNLKMFCGLVTSLPRSVDGYLANYIYSLLACQIA